MLFEQLWLTVLAWIGIAVILGFIASLVVAVTGMRVPHVRRRWGIREAFTRAAYWLAVKATRSDRTGAGRG